MVRDGRDVALSVLDLQRGMHRHAATVAHFWAGRVRTARADGSDLDPRRYMELHYERLLDDPRGQLERVCAFAGLPFSEALLHHDARVIEDVPAAERRRHSRVALPPTPGLRDWRTQMAPPEIAEFEAVAGRELEEFGYERSIVAPEAWTALRARYRLLVFAVSSLPRRVHIRTLLRRRRRGFVRELRAATD